MDRRVADRAVLVSQYGLVMERRRIGCELVRDAAMAFHTELSDARTLEHLGIRRAMRRVAGRTAFHFQRRVLKNERALFVTVALDAGRVGADRELRLLLLKPAVRIMTIAAAHRAFEHFVPEWLAELCTHLGVARHAKLRLVRAKHRMCRLSGLLCRDIANERR